MARHRRDQPASAALTFRDAADRIAMMVAGTARSDAIGALAEGVEPAAAFAALRHAMRTHQFPGPAGAISLRRAVDTLDARSRREGLHVLHGWDFNAQRRPDDITPVLLLDYCVRLGIPAEQTRRMLAVLLDQYLLALLGLLAVRAWDDGDPNANLDRVTALIEELQGPGGSGTRTVDDAETLLLLAVAYYHPEEPAYDRLLERIRTLDGAHTLRFALPCASVFGSHLRWGLRFMYRSDVGTMRDDNVVDYPWVLFALTVLMGEYDRLHAAGDGSPSRSRVVCAVLDALSADPWAFAGPVPPCLASHADEHGALRDRLERHRPALLDEFRALQPAGIYSPLGFECNFLSNAVVALVATAIDEPPEPVTLNALFAAPADSVAGAGGRTAGPPAGGSADSAARRLAKRLMEYATGDPGRLAKGGVPLVLYDQQDAAHFHNVVVRALSGRAAGPS